MNMAAYPNETDCGSGAEAQDSPHFTCPDSRERFLERAMETVYAMAIGDWSGLEQIDVGEVTEAEPRPTLRRRAVILLGAIARAVIPLVLAVAATQIDLEQRTSHSSQARLLITCLEARQSIPL